MNMWRTEICAIAATVGGLIIPLGPHAETFPYSNDFSVSGLTSSTAQSTHDAGNGVLGLRLTLQFRSRAC